MPDNQQYDLLLCGGRVICPASGIDGICDVAIRAGRIAAVAERILPSSARETIEVSGKIVLPGSDRHPRPRLSVRHRPLRPQRRHGRRPLRVTTVIDQGGPSCMTLPGFRQFVAEPATTRVYAFLSAYLVGGLEGHLLPESLQARRRRHRGHGRARRKRTGHRARHQGPRRDRRLRALGHQGAGNVGGDRRRADLPLYVHFGQLWGLPRAAPMARMPTLSSSASSRCCGRVIFWRIRSRAIPAASSTGKARCTR